jgi:hypothetical protein
MTMHGTDIEPLTCFACSRTYLTTPAHNPRFCSTNCVDQHDAGFTPRNQDHPVYDGVMLNCPGCNRPFRSRGLRSCSDKCDREYLRRIAADTELAEIRATTGVSLPKRGKPCQGPDCTKTLPPWNAKGRKNTARFCSGKCARNAAKAREAGNPPDVAGSMQEVPAAQGVAEPDPVT